MLEKSRFAAFYMCFVDIIITICVQAARFVQLKCCVRHLKPTAHAFKMLFAGRDLHILFICFIHVETQNQQMDNFKTNKLGRLRILVENLYQRTYNNMHINNRLTLDTKRK